MSFARSGGDAIREFELLSVDLPFRRAFRHAAAERSVSGSLFLRCTTRSGAVGYGECLPRAYVTGETLRDTHECLRDEVLPRLLGRSFESYAAVKAFLEGCDGLPPADWGLGGPPRTAAWCAVDLALLDAFGRSFDQPVFKPSTTAFDPEYRYSAVISASSGWALVRTLLKLRLAGLWQVKVKLGHGVGLRAIHTIRRVLGAGADIRVDLNMLWQRAEALELMPRFALAGVQAFEQPLPADDLPGLAALVEETGLIVMADESLADAGSLQRLVEARACNAVNVRISKCGGLMASIRRCREARAAGLALQLGCQVGESSLLSAAQLALMGQVEGIRYLEGCFGTHLLQSDPAQPGLRFGYGGRPPPPPEGPGLGVTMDTDILERHVVQYSPCA